MVLMSISPVSWFLPDPQLNWQKSWYLNTRSFPDWENYLLTLSRSTNVNVPSNIRIDEVCPLLLIFSLDAVINDRNGHCSLLISRKNPPSQVFNMLLKGDILLRRTHQAFWLKVFLYSRSIKVQLSLSSSEWWWWPRVAPHYTRPTGKKCQQMS